MKKRLLIIAAALGLITLIAVPFAFAQHAGRHFGHQGGGDLGVMMLGHLQHAKHVLGLSDQQVADIENIVKDLRTQNQPYRESLHSGLAGVVQTLINNPNDLAGAQAQLDKQTEAERQMKSNALVAVSKALNVLTPDQRGKLQDLVQDHLARRTAREK